MRRIQTDKFIGVPFVDGGRDLAGADCWGMTCLVFSEFGVELPDYQIGCFQSARIDAQIRHEQTAGSWEAVEAPEAPCLLLFSLDPGHPRLITHCGVYIGGGNFVHTMSKTGSVVSPLSHPYWKNKTRGFYKWKETKLQ